MGEQACTCTGKSAYHICVPHWSHAGFAKPAKILKKPGPGGFFLKNPHFHPGFLQNAGFLQFDRYNQLFSLVFLKIQYEAIEEIF